MENGEPVQSEIKGLEPSLLTGGRKSRSRKNRTRRNKRGGDGCQASLDAPTFGGSKKNKKGGKTTLANQILCLLKPLSGNLLIDNKPLKSSEIKYWQSLCYLNFYQYLFHQKKRIQIKVRANAYQILWNLWVQLL